MRRSDVVVLVTLFFALLIISTCNGGELAAEEKTASPPVPVSEVRELCKLDVEDLLVDLDPSCQRRSTCAICHVPASLCLGVAPIWLRLGRGGVGVKGNDKGMAERTQEAMSCVAKKLLACSAVSTPAYVAK